MLHEKRLNANAHITFFAAHRSASATRLPAERRASGILRQFLIEIRQAHEFESQTP